MTQAIHRICNYFNTEWSVFDVSASFSGVACLLECLLSPCALDIVNSLLSLRALDIGAWSSVILEDICPANFCLALCLAMMRSSSGLFFFRVDSFIFVSFSVTGSIDGMLLMRLVTVDGVFTTFISTEAAKQIVCDTSSYYQDILYCWLVVVMNSFLTFDILCLN